MRWVRLWHLVIVLLLALTPTPARAAEPRFDGEVIVGPGEIIEDDLYAFGGTVTIQGTVMGDVIAFGGSVSVAGPVTGDVIIAGGNTTISGEVGGSVRAAGGDLVITGPVGEDVLVGAGTLSIGPDARIGRDLLVGSGSATVAGQVGRNVLAGAGDLTLAGTVDGNVRAAVETLRVMPSAVIGGNLAYTSEREAEIAPGATVRGTVERQEPERAPAERDPLARARDQALGWLRTLVGMFALGALFVLLVPGFSRRTADTLGRSPWASLGLGVALLLTVPLAALLLFLIGLVVGGWWLGIITLALYGIGLALSYAMTGLFVGRWLLVRAGRTGVHLVWALLLGLILLTLAGLLPFVGGVIVLLAVLFGLGALVLAGARARQMAAPAASV
ncbi:MAG: hypothetical protein HY689_13120 [Chloroflexi bacterium]|nr:hypothetical protein [Chloroflexota bacterium]